MYRRLGGPQGRSEQVRKISPPPGFDPRTVPPVPSRYTDYATRLIFTSVKKVKCILVHALRLYTGRTAHRGSRGIALLFLHHGSRRRARGQRHSPAAFYPRERPGTHCTGGWVGPRAGLDGCGKSLPHRIRFPDRPARSSVSIPTELPGPSLPQQKCNVQ